MSNSIIFAILFDTIAVHSGETIECKIKSVGKESIVYVSDKTDKTISANKVDYLLVAGIPDEFSEAFQFISEGKYAFAKGKFKEALDSVAKKPTIDSAGIIRAQCEYFLLLCDIKEGRYKKDKTILINLLESIHSTDAKKTQLSYVFRYKDSFILYKVLESVLEVYAHADLLGDYLKILKENEVGFSSEAVDELYMNLADHYISNIKDRSKALEILNGRVFGDGFQVGLRKVNLLFDDMSQRSVVSNLIGELSQSARSDEEIFTVNYLSAKLDYVSGEQMPALRKLIKLISRLNPYKFKKTSEVVSSLKLLAQIYEEVSGKMTENKSKARYLAMSASTLRELLGYFPSIQDRSVVADKITELDSSIDKLFEEQKQ